MIQWTIYDHPRDHPTMFVARKWWVDGNGPQPTTDMMISANVEDLRSAMAQMGLTCLPRYPDDDPVILEVWL
jgi:hypothetical protein